MSVAGRTSADYAIEFGEYLAKAAEAFIADCDEHPLNPNASADSYRALKSAIYEFRKRVSIRVPQPKARGRG